MHQDPARDRRALQDALLGARLTTHVARRFRPACVGMKHKDFFTFVAAIVGVQMKAYVALPPS